MHPATGPDRDTKTDTERKLYYVFKERLSDEFRVFHSVHWHSEDDKGRAEDGEADFVVIHPRYGVAVLEVKGGPVYFDGASNTFVRGRGLAKRPVDPSPDRQAMVSSKVLRRTLLRSPITKALANRVRIGWAVVLPDSTYDPDQHVGMVGHDYVVLTKKHLRDPQEAILRVMQHIAGAKERPPLDEDTISQLVSIMQLGTEDELIGPLADDIDGEAKTVRQFSQEQFARFTEMWRNDRQLKVTGPAGTGKTVLAMEMATRLTTEGYDALLLVRNENMADYLRSRMAQDFRLNKPTFTVHSLKSLVAEQTQQVGMQSDAAINTADVATESGQATLAYLLQRVHTVREKRGEPSPYDAVLIDDAEDLEQQLFIPIEKLRRDRAHGFLYLFYDEGQRLDGGDTWELRLGTKPKPATLSQNYRNTAAIYERMVELNPDLKRNTHAGPKGREPQFIDPAKMVVVPGSRLDEVGVALRQALDELEDGGVRPEDILIVTCRGRERSRWHRAEDRRLVADNLRWLREGTKEGHVALSTIRGAKGLEYKVVILAELDGIDDEVSQPSSSVATVSKRNAARTQARVKHDRLLYVAISRAMYHLLVLGPPSSLQPKQTAIPLTLWAR